MARLIQPERPSTSALAVMREWRPADFRANYARVMVEAAEQRRNDLAQARRYLATASMIRQVAHVLAPSRIP